MTGVEGVPGPAASTEAATRHAVEVLRVEWPPPADSPLARPDHTTPETQA